MNITCFQPTQRRNVENKNKLYKQL